MKKHFDANLLFIYERNLIHAHFYIKNYYNFHRKKRAFLKRVFLKRIFVSKIAF